MLPALLQHFATLDDPRLARTRLHSFTDILGVALCAVICGAARFSLTTSSINFTDAIA